MYGICRVRNLKMSDLKSTQQHNAREYEEGRAPDNLGHDIWGDGDMTFHEVMDDDCDSISSAIEKKFEREEVKIRKDSIVAIEYVLSASPSWWKKAEGQDYDFDALLSHMRKFVSERHGANNVISISHHFDESTPHAHIVVTPVEKKTLQYKNKQGNCFKTKNVLSARNYTNKKHQYRQLQSDWTNFFNARIASRFKDVDMRVQRGVDVIEQERKYIKSTSHEIGHLRAELEKLQSLQMSILQKWEEIQGEEKERAKETLDKSMLRSEALKEKIESKTDSIQESEKKIVHKKSLYKKGKNDNWKKGHSFD